MILKGYSSMNLLDVLSYNPMTGAFTWKVNVGRAYVGDVAGTVNNRAGALVIGFKGKRILAHRLAWFVHYGIWPKGDIDHINGNAKDNRIDNLRDVSHAVNTQNIRKAHKDNRSGLLGVSKAGKRYLAQLNHKGERVLCKLFDSPEEAHSAYVSKKRELHEGCTI